MRINKSVMCANFGNPRSRDCELTHNNNIETVIFGLKIYWFAHNSKTTWRAKLKLEHNVDAYEWFTQPSLGTPGHETKILLAESGQKVDHFEATYLGKYQFWWKMICDFWAQHYQSPFFWLCSFTPTWILFFVFFSFFLLFVFFFYSSPVIYF